MAEPPVRRQPASAFALLIRSRADGRDLVVACSHVQPPNAPPANLIDPTLLAANRNLRDTLQSKGYSVHYTEFNGNHTLFNWRGTLASHLIALVGIKPEPKISSSSEPFASSLSVAKRSQPLKSKCPPLC